MYTLRNINVTLGLASKSSIVWVCYPMCGIELERYLQFSPVFSMDSLKTTKVSNLAPLMEKSTIIY